jgi:DNA polymerase-3 subunit epsilon
MRNSNKAARSLGMSEKPMKVWLDELVRRNIGYYKEWQARVASRQVRVQEDRASIEGAWAAMGTSFIVADLETTGLNCATDEILELGAVLVDPGGSFVAEYSALVRVSKPIPDIITKLTGIAQNDVDRDGRTLDDAIRGFVAFVGTKPVFFHNAPFDVGFLRAAAAKAALQMPTFIHDTLPIARAAWPMLGSYRLTALAAHVGCDAPAHRALADARAAAAVLLAARAIG